MREPVVEGIPEIAGPTGLSAGHTEVVTIARKVSLDGHVDTNIVSDIMRRISSAAIIVVSFVVARTNYI